MGNILSAKNCNLGNQSITKEEDMHYKELKDKQVNILQKKLRQLTLKLIMIKKF
jgi:hypothetical protein